MGQLTKHDVAGVIAAAINLGYIPNVLLWWIDYQKDWDKAAISALIERYEEFSEAYERAISDDLYV